MKINLNLCSCLYTFNDYSHMLFFSNKVNRNAYFKSTVKLSLSINLHYDDNLSEISVPVKLSDLEGINYLYFNDKFFFIDDKVIINDNVTNLIVRLDVLQTYLYDCTFFPSFVDRCHVPRTKLNGYPTEEVVPEGLSIGDYVVKDKEVISPLTSSCVLATTTPLGFLEENIDFNPVSEIEEGGE